MKTLSKRQSGFTLMEVVLSLAIVAGCVIPMVAIILPEALNSNQNALNRTAAASVLASVVSDLRSATPTTVGGVTSYRSPLFQFQIPQAGGTSSISNASTPQQAFVDQNGGVVVANGVTPTATQLANSTFCVTVGFLPPSTGVRKATGARIMISWPPRANATTGTWPVNYVDSIENTIYLDLN